MAIKGRTGTHERVRQLLSRRETIRLAGAAGAAALFSSSPFSAAAPASDAASSEPHRRSPESAPRAGRNPEIVRILEEIDGRNIERTILRLVAFGTRSTLSAQDNPARGIGAARDWLFGEFSKAAAASGGRMTVEKQSFLGEANPPPFRPLPRPTMITNVVATLRGTQPESTRRIYVVSGHYDSRCSSSADAVHDAPGADDDASGTAAVLEMARVMARYRFNATLIFMAVAGEEQGLFGSTHFAERARQQGLDIEGMLNNDIIGSSRGENGVRDRRSVRVFSGGVPSAETEAEALTLRRLGDVNDSASRQLARFIKEVGEPYVPGFTVRLIYRPDRYLRGGDQIPFLLQGYPAVRFTEPNEDYRHQHQDVRVENGVRYGDLPQFDDFDYIAQVARLNAASLAGLALAPATPRNAGILVRRLTNDTDLQWAPNPEPNLAGYEVVWRETTEPLWTHSIWVGNRTRCTVQGMSKDNYFFGVRAVDEQGNSSPVAYPMPVR